MGTYAGLYRKHPVASNLFSFALECWHLGLTLLGILLRLLKFLLATGIYVGRIDKPILQQDLLLDLDNFPRAFRQDLVLAEAHRHPYMERLGAMVRQNFFSCYLPNMQMIHIPPAHHRFFFQLIRQYMMKLRYQDQFSTPAGATWRLLFVMALMPWLRKYRIQNDNFDLNVLQLRLQNQDMKPEQSPEITYNEPSPMLMEELENRVKELEKKNRKLEKKCKKLEDKLV